MLMQKECLCLVSKTTKKLCVLCSYAPACRWLSQAGLKRAFSWGNSKILTLAFAGLTIASGSTPNSSFLRPLFD